MLPIPAQTPGQYIQQLLDEKKWSRRVLAIILQVNEAVITRLVANKQPVDAARALQLGGVFGVQPDKFLELQRGYDLAVARISALPDPSMSRRAQLFGDLPVLDMLSRGWLDVSDFKDFPRVEESLAKFFGVPSIADLEIAHVAKKTHGSEPATPAQLAWIYRVKQIAKDMLVAKYSPEAVRTAIERLKPLRAGLPDIRRVPKVLMEAGIRFVIVEALPSSKIDGVCFWLNDFAPVIGMSLRHDRIDNFWFVLRHEIEHVAQRHGTTVAMLDADLDDASTSDSEEERIANAAAAAFCVPPADMRAFVSRKSPIFAERDIIGFARSIKVHPGLVAGQLRHLTGRFDRYATHLSKVRSTVLPNALVDGWGDVAPVE